MIVGFKAIYICFDALIQFPHGYYSALDLWGEVTPTLAIVTRGNWIFLRAKMKSYNATWIVDMISIVQIITWRWLCNVIMSIVAACSILLSRLCQGQYVTSVWPWDQSDWFYRDRNIRKPHGSILYGFIINFTLNFTERSNSDLRVTLTQKLTLPLWPPSQQTPISQVILLYNE